MMGLGFLPRGDAFRECKDADRVQSQNARIGQWRKAELSVKFF